MSKWICKSATACQMTYVDLKLKNSMFGADAYWLGHHQFSCDWGLVVIGLGATSFSVIDSVFTGLGVNH